MLLRRGDLEKVRTMADQMRRHDKLRKQDLASWKAGLEQHLALPGSHRNVVRSHAVMHHVPCLLVQASRAASLRPACPLMPGI